MGIVVSFWRRQRLRLGGRLAGWVEALRRELFDAPLEPILHASPWRLRWIGIFTLVAHPVIGWIWTYAWPQPWESLWLRAALALLGVPMLVGGLHKGDEAGGMARYFVLMAWLQLPLLFSWMFLCNGGNPAWLASWCVMVLMYYHLTDWRIATLGTLSGVLAGWVLFGLLHAPQAAAFELEGESAVVLAFAWAAAMALGFSSANLRREHLRHTLATMGIMAHELRTPLATASLLGEALRREARERDEPMARRVDELAVRLHALVRNMNLQIDRQIANARLLNLPRGAEVVDAAALVREAVAAYPYRTSREREAVRVTVRRDFRFRGSAPVFTQVMFNLLKNALHALAAAGSAPQAGDLRVEVGVLHGRGRLVVSDRGVGMEPAVLRRIFEPFFSTDRGTGHGLGLAFCQRAVASAHGRIRVRSTPMRGTMVMIDLPVLDD